MLSPSAISLSQSFITWRACSSNDVVRSIAMGFSGPIIGHHGASFPPLDISWAIFAMSLTIGGTAWLGLENCDRYSSFCSQVRSSSPRYTPFVINELENAMR